MLNRKNFLFILTGTFIVTLLIVFLFIIGIKGKKKGDLAEEETVESIDEMFERELFSDTKLQEQAGDFALPANLLKLFHEHEEQLNELVQYSFCSNEKEDSFFAEYIDGKRFYFHLPGMVWRENVEKSSSIQDGEYEYMTSFMEYAIDRGLVFRDWMLDIHRYNPVNCEEENIAIGRKQALLSITVYSGNGLEIRFEYFADREGDNSEEDYEESGGCIAGGGIKKTRINSNWYYSYYIIEISDGWRPDLKDLAFSEEFYARRRTTAVMRHILTENLRGFLRLYWEYGLDFKEISWWDLESLRWTEWYIPEPVY